MITQKCVRTILYFLISFSLLGSGCGYRFSVEGMGPRIGGGMVDDGLLVPLTIRDFLNRTFHNDLGFKYTRYMRQEFAASSGAKVVYNDREADFVMKGEIVSVRVPALSFSTTNVRESQVTVSVLVKVEERRTGLIVWSDKATGAAAFFVNQSLDTGAGLDQLQFNQVLRDRALEQAGQDVAENLAANFWDARARGIFSSGRKKALTPTISTEREFPVGKKSN